MSTQRLNSRLGSRRRGGGEPGRRWVRVVIAVLATIGAIDTGAVTVKKWGVLGALTCSKDALFGCNGCEQVLSSGWGTVAGQPLSLFGFLAYASVLLLAVLPLVLRGEAKAKLTDASWWGLFLISTGMAVFSAVLIGVMLLAIKSCCPFCILSAVLSLSLFVLSLFGGEWEDRGQLLFRGILLALVVGLISLGWAASVNRPAALATKGVPMAVVRESTPQTLALAEHLTAEGAVMYTAWWCPHCHEQKELFGKQATAKLKLIECAPDGQNSQRALCEQKKIEGFPSWEIKGSLSSGVKTLKELAKLSEFKGPVAP
ncbi:vitamin K epoxide reductase family protein [Cyanobium sp. Morenito 9A2]|uniref:vitamin K epoxide reductase family protein n=1 Tax=Cyanobium sp. Morenito 9A2 TaxID=2823718 RepID=UPI0020CF8223|nr:vitamin K epoxide reductase family protein [Cyanobium sp. Morenito 9A2]MCP9851055.1 vitamin K epoxide reductase family protein [Cyanobium sp. Morenito 9A2]